MSDGFQLPSVRKIENELLFPVTISIQRRQHARALSAMKVVFLGTNGWYDTATGNTTCILIDTSDYYIILDAGSGLHKVDIYTRKRKPVYLFLSHFHLDHIYGLHMLNRLDFQKGLHIYGPAGTRKVLKMLINKPFTVPISKLPFDVAIHELPKETGGVPFSVRCKPLLHSSLTLGYRFEMGGRVITYCPDTGYCKNAVTLARNADLLITECAYKHGQRSETWPHLNPDDAAKVAREAGARRLALVHFDASIYKTMKMRQQAEAYASKIFPYTIAVEDELTIEI